MFSTGGLYACMHVSIYFISSSKNVFIVCVRPATIVYFYWEQQRELLSYIFCMQQIYLNRKDCELSFFRCSTFRILSHIRICSSTLIAFLCSLAKHVQFSSKGEFYENTPFTGHPVYRSI